MKQQNVLKVCDVTDDTGKIRSEFPRSHESDWVPDGICVVLRDDETVLMEITYSKGVPHGDYVDYWTSGGVASKGRFSSGKQIGTWHFFNEDGTLLATHQFSAEDQC